MKFVGYGKVVVMNLISIDYYFFGYSVFDLATSDMFVGSQSFQI